MKRGKLFVLCLAIINILFISGCKHTTEKIIKEKYNDGTPMVVEYAIKNNKDSSLTQNTFYQGNKLQSKGEMKHGKKEGKWTFYYENGNKWSEGYFKDGVEQGLRTVFYENRKKRYEGLFKDGEKTGSWKFWDENGKLIKQIEY